MNLSHLLDLSYLFNARPGSDFQYMVVLIVFFLALILGSFYVENGIRKHPNRKSLQKIVPHLGSRLRTLGVIGFILLWIRYENLPYLAIRAWLLLYLLGILAYIAWSYRAFKTQLPQAVQAENARQNHRDYLPKSKKKKKKQKRKKRR